MTFYAKAKTVNSIHSPFVYQLLMECLENRRLYNAYAEIDLLRNLLAQDSREFDLVDFGVGSTQFKSSKRTVSSILDTSVLSERESHFLFNLTRITTPKTVLELGTSLGISALSMCLGTSQVRVHTIEGDPFIHELAAGNFIKSGVNVIAHLGNFDQVLPKLLPTLDPIDLVYIDGNHSHRATLAYHNILKPYLSKKAILVYDDIYWSAGMTKAWQELQTDSNFQYTIDVFDFGIMIKHEQAKAKQHFTIIERRKKPFSLGFWG